MNKHAYVGKVQKGTYFTGLPDSYESEGFTGVHLSLPSGYIALIDAVYKVQKNIVVILYNGAPVEMPWIHKTKSVLEGYLG